MHVGVGAPTARSRSATGCELLPPLLALSANSPFLDHRDTGLHSVRTEIFTRVFPRCGVHEPFGDWGTYAGFVDTLARTRSIVEATQLWWSVRPHHSFGTVEVRICDAQTRGDESLNLAAMMLACVAQTALDIDERGHAAAGPGAAGRRSRRTLWRAIRWGLDGEMIDFRRGQVIPTRGPRGDRGVDRARAAAAASRWRSRGQRRPARARLGRRGAADRGVLQALDRRDPRDLRAVFGRGRG